MRTALDETNNGSFGILSSVFGTDPGGPVFRDPQNPYHATSLMGYDPGNPYSYYFPAKYSGGANPLLDIVKQAENYAKSTRIIGGISSDFVIFDGLTFNSNFSFEKYNQNDFNFSPQYTLSPNNQNLSTKLSQKYVFDNSWVWSNMLNYKKEFGKNSLNILA